MTLTQRYRKMPWGGRKPQSGIPVTYNNSTYNVDPSTIRQIATNARTRGIDPYTALSIGYQESGLDSNNPYHLNPDYFGQSFGSASSGVESIQKQLAYANRLQSKGTIPQGEDYTLQGYNGYGTITQGHADLEGATSIYGQKIPKTGLNLRKNPLYGKRIIDIRENVLKKNPQLVSEVEKIMNTGPTRTRTFNSRTIKPFA
jgi:hypothetical protein